MIIPILAVMLSWLSVTAQDINRRNGKLTEQAIRP